MQIQLQIMIATQKMINIELKMINIQLIRIVYNCVKQINKQHIFQNNKNKQKLVLQLNLPILNIGNLFISEFYKNTYKLGFYNQKNIKNIIIKIYFPFRSITIHSIPKHIAQMRKRKSLPFDGPISTILISTIILLLTYQTYNQNSCAFDEQNYGSCRPSTANSAGYCWQNTGGVRYSCSANNTGYWQYGSRSWCQAATCCNNLGDWYCYDSRVVYYYQDCDSRCATCTSSGFNACQSCKAGWFHWLINTWQLTHTCRGYCPRAAYVTGRLGQYRPTTGTQCTDCPNNCTWCQDGASSNDCYTCQPGMYLVDDTFDGQCTTRFSFDFTSSGTNCSINLRCNPTCPLYYFQVLQGSTANYPYTGRTNRSDDQGVYFHTMRYSDVCIPCDYQCRDCWEQYYWTCYDCTMYSYKWVQTGHNYYCQHYCPTGDFYTTAGTYHGQFIATQGSRFCTSCNTNCRFCITSASQCYMCRDGSFLIDNKDICATRYPITADYTIPASKTNCRKCRYYRQINPAQTCQTVDKICRLSTCPTYFYYRVWYLNDPASANPATAQLSSRYAGYSSWVNASSITGSANNNSQYYVYRYQTNLCMLCDKRCVLCGGPTNLNCTQCANGYFKWNQQNICSQNCPSMQYEDHFNSTANFHDTQCKYCDNRCFQCQNYFNNCTICKGTQATFADINSSFLYTSNNSWSTCMTQCPVSTNPSTVKGWYGSIKTQTCYQCPGGCSNCNINITRNDVNIYCTDKYCTQGISCTSCLLGYVLVSGKCIVQKSCQRYAYYLAGNVSTQWTSDKCFCLRGYFMNAYVACNVLCHFTCQTCTGSLNTQCSSCQQGYSLSGTSCVATQTKRQHYYPSGTGFAQFTASPAGVFSTCGSHSLTFGYRQTQTSKYIRYVSDLISPWNYYGFSVKMRILFIDSWPSSGAIKIHKDSLTNPASFSWTYDNYGAFGQQACGSNELDYLMTIYGEVKYQPITNYVQFYITSNADLFATYPNWGIKDIVVTTLACHSQCSSCTGPLATDCTVCSDTTRRFVNGSCLCNTASNYYQQGTTCQTTCTAGFYKDPMTAKCVIPTSCTAPFRFADPFSGNCVSDCPPTYYAQHSTKMCVTNCGLTNQYKYDGSSRSCQDICPTNFMAYPSLSGTSFWVCVAKCPTGWYLKLQNRLTNPQCADVCPSGWQDEDLSECVLTCPNGYFKQTLLGQNKCVKVCTGKFGLNSTGQCVDYCPYPLFADPTTQLCQKQCPDTYYFQIAIAPAGAVGNRTCVQTCQNGQWGNPFFKSCQKNPMNCPVGYFADNHTHLCQQTCTLLGQVGQNTTRMCQTMCTTGFAYWNAKKCVNICPQNPPLFSYVSGATRVCVSSCNSSSTGLFGDAQANRSCVARCTATPTATFGQISTNLCVDKCSVSNQYGDPLHATRRCVTTCTQSPQTFSYVVTKLCVQTCPDNYYGDNYTTLSLGVCATGCPNNYYADPISHLCVSICPVGYYGSQLTGRPCVLKCPLTYYGQNKTGNRVCVLTCDTGFWADQATRLCTNVKTECSNNTYADAYQQKCVNATLCTATPATYADPFTKGCQSGCSNASYFGDPFTHTCVTLCSQVPQQYSQNGYCVTGCGGSTFADFQDNRKCNVNCSRTPLALYGNKNTWKCVIPANCPALTFADNLTLTCVNPCTGTLPYGDPISRQCVSNCPDDYYGDLVLHKCVQFCDSINGYYADNITGNCQQTCSVPTYGTNSTTAPRCQNQCPSGSFAKDGIRICVLDCGPGFYGDPIKRKCSSNPFDCSPGYYVNSVSNLCVLPVNCQTVSSKHYFAQNSTKTCISQCIIPNYGDNNLWLCIPTCNATSFGQNNTRQCLTGCATYLSFAEDQLHMCVSRCSAAPVGHFAQTVTYKCVEPRNCPPNTYAQNDTRTCVSYCPKTPNMTYADVYVSKRCVLTCPDTYYADDSIVLGGQCVINCAGINRFRQNSTKSCVSICPSSQGTFGDTVGDMCVKTCPDGTYAQQDVNRRCVPTCAANSWGNKITKICVLNPVTECPPNTWADDNTHLCQQVCSITPSTYGQNITKKCIGSCPSPSFAYDVTRVCIDICPASLVDSGYFGDPDLTPTRKCVKVCQTANLYRDIAASRTCKTTCTFNNSYKTYKDPTTMSCQSTCSDYPQVRYSDDFSQTCELACNNGGLKKNDKTRSCVANCSALHQPNQNKCVDKCPAHSILNVPLYADLTLKKCVQYNDCPINTYASDDSMECVSTCPINTYIDGKMCVYSCPDNYFMDKANAKCVTPSNCPANQYADYQSRSCVTTCPGTFADRNTKKCVNVCTGSTYADQLTGFCQNSCSTGFVINTANNTCQSDCAVGLFKNPRNNSCSATCIDPYFADQTTRTCVQLCTSNPLTFASTANGRKCVSVCLITQWYDMAARKCVTTCPNNTYSYDFNRSCLSFCPGPSYYSLGTECVTNCSVQSKYSDDKTRSCVATCPTGYFRDDTTFKCVVICPQKYYSSVTLLSCTNSCPSGTYADQQKKACVANCSTAPAVFAEETNKICIQMCPAALSSFADYTTFKCVLQCPNGYYADNRTRQCKANCSDWFADDNKIPKSCTTMCQLNTFADQTTYKCVGKCPNNYYGLDSSRKCIQFCPFGFFTDNSTNKCVLKCPALYPYADSLTRMCVTSCSKGQFAFLATGQTQWGVCQYICPPNYFSNPLTGKCVTSCPTDYFSQTTNNTCMKTCPLNKFKDSVNKKCVPSCPVANLLFGNRFTMECVTTCNASLQIYADSLTQFCQITCTGDQYKTKDVNGRNVCVGRTGCLNGQFSDPYMKACVNQCYNNTFGYNGVCYAVCPTTLLFANPISKTCVTALNCPNGFFADTDKRRCVQFCDLTNNTYADKDLKKCVTGCTTPYYADNSTRICVTKCPDIPKLYARQSDRICVQRCPPNRFADQLTNKCQLGCQSGYFADESTWSCVKKCPQGKFGDNSTNYCVPTCPQIQGYFGNPHPQSRICVKYCPNNTFADPNNNRQCRSYCLAPLFSQNLTNTCQSSCKTGFSNQRSRQCILVCTTGYYGFQGVCYKYQCPSATPTVFADDSTSLCKTQCPSGTFGDTSTRKCVPICPISQNTYGDTVNHLCVNPCPGGYFMDPSTQRCVDRCPSVPALFASPSQKTCLETCTFDRYADNSTRSCVTVTQCPDGTYADNSTMKCVSQCPSKPMMWGMNITNKCVFVCPIQYDRYADNASRTCIDVCPQKDNTFADPQKRACVATCSITYFAINSTRRCSKICPDGQFADVLLRKCVAKCSVNPVYYGNRNTKQCVPQCPSFSYGNPLTQQCVFDVNGISTCPSGYYADDTTRLCVQKCPMKQKLYGDPLTKKCQLACSDSLYLRDNSTMLCVTKCPQYPNYYADYANKNCVAFCSQSWADDISRTCVSDCPVDTYSQNSTWQCLPTCLRNPLRFADNTTGTCVDKCPNGTYADRLTYKCVPKCPELDNTFGYNITQTCVKTCPNNTYAQNSTRICVALCWNKNLADNSSNKCLQKCPSYPAYYADFNNNICVQKCPLNYFSHQINRTCVTNCLDPGLYRQNDTRKCVKNCNYSLSQYADNLTGFCVLRCSVNTWADPTTKKCVSQCPNPPMLYASNQTQSCVQMCPTPTYGDNTTRSCVDKCPTNSLSLQDKNLCVRYCPVGYFAYTQTAFCLAICPQPYYGDPSTRTCVLECPLIQLLYADNSTRQCVKMCPPASYADKKSKFCVRQCPLKSSPSQAQTYAADYNNKCVEQCSVPTFAYQPTLKCYNKCPDPYYNNITDHKCWLCPSVCTACTSPTGCLACVSNYYLQNGQCVSQCSGNYYANATTMNCVSSVSCRPYFGVNSTNLCSPNCPYGQWKNINAYRCDACPATCESCTSLSFCMICKSNAVYSNNFCYGFCKDSVTRYYSSDNKTCLSECSNGTYLSVLFCKTCAPACVTCLGTPDNCTLCSGGLYLQNTTCVSQCSTGYKPTKDLMCISCGTTCDQGLTFNSNITTVDGQTNVFINFNSDVNINGDLYDTFAIQTSGRRLLQEDHNNQGIDNKNKYQKTIGAIRNLQTTPPPYTIIKIDDKTIKIVFPPGYSAQNYNFKIVNPQNIVDQYGNIPSSTRADLAVDTSNLYDSNVGNHFSSYFMFLAVICLFSFIFDTQLMKFLQLIYVHYFAVMTLPPELTKILVSLRISTIDFIPAIYTVPEKVLKMTVDGKIYDLIGDYSFLRTAASSITIFIVILLVFLILKALSLPQINKSKTLRIWAKQLIDQKFTFAVWIQYMLIMYVNTIFMVFLQLRDMNQYQAFSTASIVLAFFVFAVCVIVIGLLVYRIITFFNQYPKLSENLKKASDIIMKDDQFKFLNSSNIFMFQRKKIDLRNLMYPKVNNQNILPFKNSYRFNFLALFAPMVTLIRLTLLALVISLSTSTIMQMSLAIPINVLALLYFSKVRPYSFKQKKYRVRNYIAIYHEVCLIIFEFLMLGLGIMQRDKAKSFQKQDYSYYIVYYLTIVTVPSFIYFVFRSVIFCHRKIYVPFMQSQLFKKNFPEKWAAYQASKNKEKKLTRGIDPLAKKALKSLITGVKSKQSLRPTQKDKANPQLPMKHKITYFDRDSSSNATSNTSMSRKQKKKMLNQLFSNSNRQQLNQKQIAQSYEQMRNDDESDKNTQIEYEEYEQQYEIKVKDLAKYVANAQQFLRLMKKNEEEN